MGGRDFEFDALTGLPNRVLFLDRLEHSLTRARRERRGGALLLTHAVKVDLPKASSTPNQTKPDNIQIAIDAASQVYWNGEVVAPEVFTEHMRAAAALQPQPELHLRAESLTPYEKVAQVMSEAARHGLTRIGFVTDPSMMR
jgi:biopolymer transport protein ExbD